MSHYAFASGIMNLGVMLPGMVSGYLSDLLPDAVGQAHAFRQMDAYGPQQDDDQGGDADILESCLLYTSRCV